MATSTSQGDIIDVFGYGTDEASRPLLSPAICFLCENSPTQEAEKVIDTKREFNPECLTRLSGRKYICGACAKELGQAVGLVTVEEFEAVTDQFAELRAANEANVALVNKLRDEQHRVMGVDEVEDMLGSIRIELESLRKPKPAPRAAKPAPDA